MVGPLIVVVIPKTQQLLLQVTGSPKERVIEKLPPDRADQSFDESMRQRDVWHGPHLRDLKDPQIGLPL